MALDLRRLVASLEAPARSALEAAAGLALANTHSSVGVAHLLTKLLEARGPLAVELGQQIELGRLTRTATPHLDAVYALMRLLGHSLAEAHGRLAIRSH